MSSSKTEKKVEEPIVEVPPEVVQEIEPPKRLSRVGAPVYSVVNRTAEKVSLTHKGKWVEIQPRASVVLSGDSTELTRLIKLRRLRAATL